MNKAITFLWISSTYSQNTINCDFENSQCGWNDENGSNIPWSRRQATFYFNKTGPFVDHTTNSSLGYFLAIGIYNQYADELSGY
jgi:hypothetical protein